MSSLPDGNCLWRRTAKLPMPGGPMACNESTAVTGAATSKTTARNDPSNAWMLQVDPAPGVPEVDADIAALPSYRIAFVAIDDVWDTVPSKWAAAVPSGAVTSSWKDSV